MWSQLKMTPVFDSNNDNFARICTSLYTVLCCNMLLLILKITGAGSEHISHMIYY